MPAYPSVRTDGDIEIITELPYRETDRFNVVRSELPCGKIYAHNWRGETEERVFTLRYSVITTDELNVVEDFFREMGGRLGTFTFEDDDETEWPKCRFDMDELRIEYAGPGVRNCEVRIRAIKW